MVAAPRVVLVGPHGYGRWHLANLRRLAKRIDLRLVGVCAVEPLDEELQALAGPVPVSPSLADLLVATEPDVTIVCTPIHTHVELALEAMELGSHVLLEKPPASSLAEYERLLHGMRHTGKACQIGFKSLGSFALPAIAWLIAEGLIGDVRGIGGAGAWVRSSGYYSRSQWAGRRQIDGRPVMDGALTNPFLHAIASALRVDGSEGPGQLARVETELYRANPIEADDTSCIRLTTSAGTTITVAVTLCGMHERDPYLLIHGTRGRLTLWYRRGEVQLETPTATKSTVHPSIDLLENLLDHVRDRALPLLAPAERTHAVMEVVEAVRTSPEPTPIARKWQAVEADNGQERRVVVGVDDAVDASATRLLMFSELGIPWAQGPTSTMSPAIVRVGDSLDRD